ncbi:patatin-like phospholipase family protein [Nostoc sp. FACHB-87]|uniref:patatin-like phospholipase family protein n=1 Tax=Nostocaceae TaxID=1162 RepID=UPI0016845C36|nr:MULTISPECIES: patatin-like phospholipase family protein [Nostocaceae]MBD2455049.1 patatin-like phospholipase family protein [Nostoc sp. FACHB-87]MBD2474630.1 patatin-like phospholipase family protein [Anabaena sp. FACHB-83]
MAYRYKILSIDGGGIRGIIPGIILAEIEKRAGKPICQLFNLIAGTSTGGILSAGLTKPHPHHPNQPHFKAEDLIDIYRKEGKRIFAESTLAKTFKLDDIVKAKYSSKGRDEVLTEYLQDTALKKALTDLFITSYDIELRMPIFFVNNVKNQKLGENFRKICDGYTMKQAGMATSAAPTYFKPYKIDTVGEKSGYYALVDGGVFANNPTSLAIMEALISSARPDPQNPDKKPLTINDILVVSLGTGSLLRQYNYNQAVNWGLVQWVQPLLSITLDGSSESVACQLEQMLPQADGYPKQYYRFQGQLTEANDDMDDTSPENIARLITLAQQIIKQRDSELDELCQQLKSGINLQEQPEKSLVVGR